MSLLALVMLAGAANAFTPANAGSAKRMPFAHPNPQPAPGSISLPAVGFRAQQLEQRQRLNAMNGDNL